MDPISRYIAKILFRNKIFECKGSEFQNFFVDIMGRANPNFRSIKPQGKEGDWKNDGYDSTTGIFYQVYAPETPEARISDAVKKLVDAFEGLLEKWNDLVQVKQFYFVFNDEFRNAYPEIEAALIEMSKKHGIQCVPFLAKDLQSVFESLSDDDKQFCLRCPIPSIDSLSDIVSFESLNQVINHIQNLPSNIRKLDKAPPNFEHKIKFNLLSKNIDDLLNRGQHQIGALEQYFATEYDLKLVIKEKLAGLYESGKANIPIEHEERNDEIFFYIFDKICPPESRSESISNAVIILMSYYFAYCDIFEHPQTTLFE